MKTCAPEKPTTKYGQQPQQTQRATETLWSQPEDTEDAEQAMQVQV